MSLRYFVACYENERVDKVVEFFGEIGARAYKDKYNLNCDDGDWFGSGRAELYSIPESKIEEFLNELPKAPKLPSLDTFLTLKEKAVTFVERKHSGQRYGELPYIAHLTHVYDVAKRLGVNPGISKLNQEILLACLLHDTIEDTDATFEEIEEMFSKNVANLVDSVSLPKGMNRNEGYSIVYDKIRSHPASAIVKAADRIANLESSLHERPDKIEKYLSETEEFNTTIFDCIKGSPLAEPVKSALIEIYSIIKRNVN